MKNAWTYSLLVWITSSILSPVVCNLITLFNGVGWSRYISDALGLIFVEMLFAVSLSFFSLLLLFAVTYIFVKQSFNEIEIKVFLTLLGILLTAAPLLFMFGTNSVFKTSSFASLRFIVYSIVTTVCIWFYRLTRGEAETISETVD